MKIFLSCFSIVSPMNLLAKLLFWLRPHYFDIDLSAIQRLGSTNNRAQFFQVIENLHYVQNRDRGFFASTLPVGVSTDKLAQLETLFKED